MTLQAADAVHINIGNGSDPESFSRLASIRSLRLEVENSPVPQNLVQGDGWHRQVDSAGRQRVRIQLRGLFHNSTAEEALRAQAFDHSTVNYQIDFDNGDQLSGPFQVSRYERRGDYEEIAEGFALQLTSNGPVQFVTA
jgi:predicted secreted protein